MGPDNCRIGDIISRTSADVLSRIISGTYFLKMKFLWNLKIFIQENAFGLVVQCKMTHHAKFSLLPTCSLYLCYLHLSLTFLYLYLCFIISPSSPSLSLVCACLWWSAHQLICGNIGRKKAQCVENLPNSTWKVCFTSPWTFSTIQNKHFFWRWNHWIAGLPISESEVFWLESVGLGQRASAILGEGNFSYHYPWRRLLCVVKSWLGNYFEIFRTVSILKFIGWILQSYWSCARRKGRRIYVHVCLTTPSNKNGQRPF